MSPARDQQVGPYRLVQFIGRGGNATVWEGVSGAGERAAVKVLSATNPKKEPVRRFRDELKIHDHLSGRPGVLPFLGGALPDDLSSDNPAWLATPVATPIQESDLIATLEGVVTAVARIAETLDSMAAEGISHRDVKPDNLYEFEGEACLGDLGLVSYPDKEPLTQDNKKLGPLWYLAPEMMTSPASAVGNAADVWSLAKTLWVLATGQRYPPPGEQRVDIAPNLLRNNLSHDRAHYLDTIIEQATRTDPQLRPTMAEFARELRRWLEGDKRPSSEIPDDEIIERIRSRTEPRRRLTEERERVRREAESVKSDLREALRPAEELVRKELGLSREGLRGYITVETAGEERFEEGKRAPLVYHENVCVLLGDDYPHMASGISIRVTLDGRLYLHGVHLPERPTAPFWERGEWTSLGAPSYSATLVDLVDEFLSKLPAALDEYVALTEA